MLCEWIASITIKSPRFPRCGDRSVIVGHYFCQSFESRKTFGNPIAEIDQHVAVLEWGVFMPHNDALYTRVGRSSMRDKARRAKVPERLVQALCFLFIPGLNEYMMPPGTGFFSKSPNGDFHRHAAVLG